MAYQDKITTTIFGRRLGLQQLSSSQSGTGVAGRLPDLLVGAEAVRGAATTNDSTASSMTPYGVSYLTTGLSADATAVFRLDPPIPGVEKTIVWASTTVGTMGSKIFATISTGGGAGFQTSNGSSFTCVASSNGNVLRLMGVTTGLYAVINGTTASGFAFPTTT